ncbi:hypothetical protein Tco_0157950 [Tanacetum coccineum]
MEAFIGGLPQSIEGNVTASKPQTLEEAINISQRLMDQIIKRDSVQETNDYKRKLEDKGNILWPQESLLRNELAFVHFGFSPLETTLEDIQVSLESSSI